MLIKKIGWIMFPILIFLVLNILLSSFFQENFVFPTRFKHDIFPENEEIFDYAVVGHSHARDAFEFDLVSANGINLALSGQSIEWSDKMLRQYDNHFDANTMIIIEVSYDSFCTPIQEPRIIYVPLGFSANEIGIGLGEYIIERYFPFIGFSGVWDYFLNDRIHFADVQMEYENEDDLNSNAKLYFESTFTESNCKQEDIDRNYEDLANIIEYQLIQRRKVLLYSAPIYHEISNEFSEDIDKLVISKNLINQIAEAYEIEYFNFYNIDFISTDFKNFRNANHLNSKGAELFMNYFFGNIIE